MDLSKLIQLAESGDVQAMIELGHYYSDFDNTEHMDKDKAIYWMEKSAECGNVKGMVLTSILYTMDAHVVMQIAPADSWNNAIPKLQKALFWAEKAISLGTDATEHIVNAKLELGRAYMHAGLGSEPDEGTALHYLQLAINLLKENYAKAEVDVFLFYLAFSLFNYMDHHICLDDDDCVLMVKCYEQYTRNHNYSDDYVGVAYAHLGLLYTFGVGCEKDYNKAVECYTIATTKCNFDCSSELSHFKKKLFGGYTYINQ